MDAKGIIARCGKLKSDWSSRDRKIRSWYDVLTLKDELKQDGMESVTSNDPRTGFNLGKHLMTSSIIAHKIPTEELEAEGIASTSYLEGYVTKRWVEHEKRYRSMGRQSFKGEMVSLMLATGWLVVFSMVERDRIWSDVWNPIEVYPRFGPDGLIEVARIYTMTPAIANRRIKVMGWDVPTPITHNVSFYNYWGYDDNGDVANAMVLGQNFVKEPTVDPTLSELGVIPVFITPVGGLPDQGSITGRWQEHFGESIVATNEELIKNYNKMLTFAQQLMRDTAQPRWFEQSSGEVPILREEDLFKRGAIFRGSPGDNIGPLPVPATPVELRTMLFDYQNMLQRGLFPWAIFGNIQMQMSYLAMANVASAALQVLTPYMDALRGVLTDIDNFWVNMIRKNNYKPYGFKPPIALPDDVEFDVQADIEIPGYLIQRATVARMLDPSIRLSTDTVMDRMFPEIRDPLREQAKARKDDAMLHPKAVLVDQIMAYREQARLLRNSGDVDTAKLYEKLATSLEAELSPMPQQPQQAGARTPTEYAEESMMREVFPTREATAPVEGMGRI